MSEIFIKLYKKIDEKVKGFEIGSHEWMIGEQIKDICERSDAAAEIVLQDLDVPEMSVVKCLKKFDELADKKRKESNKRRICITPYEAEEIICKFYGISEAIAEAEEKPIKDDNVINLEDFLS